VRFLINADVFRLVPLSADQPQDNGDDYDMPDKECEGRPSKRGKHGVIREQPQAGTLVCKRPTRTIACSSGHRSLGAYACGKARGPSTIDRVPSSQTMVRSRALGVE
jgi:hypothetical protein